MNTIDTTVDIDETTAPGVIEAAIASMVPAPKAPKAKKQPKAKAAKVAKVKALATKKRAESKAKASAPKPRPVKAAKAPKGKKNTKTARAVALLIRQVGCTGSEILQATGWPTVSVPRLAEISGLKLRKEKVAGGVTRYWGTLKAGAQ